MFRFNCIFCGSPDCSNDCRIDYDNEDNVAAQEHEDYLNSLIEIEGA